jgi:hypothetical protein
MTEDGFRRLALSLPEATEVGHMGHPDFRVRGKIFATLGYPDDGWGMLKLTPEQQEALASAEPSVFAPIKGGWGRAGATNVRLQPAKVASVRLGLALAWRNVAPRGLADATRIGSSSDSTPKGRARAAGAKAPRTKAHRKAQGG